MKYYFAPEAWSQVIALPGILVDQYIKLAGKAQWRVILYLLRHVGEDIPDGALSDALALHPDEVAQALTFWQEAGLLQSRQDGGIPEKNEATAKTDETVVHVPIVHKFLPPPTGPESLPPPPVKQAPRTVTRSPMNDPAVVAGRIRESAEIKTLINEAEVILGKNLKTWEADILINLHDADGMPVDVIVMVLHYAKAREKTTVRYIERTAQSWIEQGVDTIEKAEQKIRLIQTAANAWKRVCALFRIEPRKPSTKEEEYVLRWIEEWHLPDELLLLAYDRCADSTGKMKFAYMNKILQRWTSEGYTSVRQVEAGESSPAPSAKEKPPRPKTKQKSSYDLEVFEQMLMGERPVHAEEKKREETT